MRAPRAALAHARRRGVPASLGDPAPSPERLPEGLEGEVRYANARGLAGGLWSAPFALDPASETARARPEWVSALEPRLGRAGVPAGSLVLDLSRDDVVAHVREFARTANALGLAWSEQDLTHHALWSAPARDEVTAVGAYRRGWSAVRDETRDGAFLLASAAFGASYGLADGVRTGPIALGGWDESRADAEGSLATGRALKSVVRSASRRWYLNDRVAVLDPGPVALREVGAHTSADREQRTFALFVALLGGVVELGDPLVDLRPEGLDVVRRIVPPYGESARPLDVFTREYNERWVLPVRAWSDEPDAPAPWVVAAVTHWGANRDTSRTPFEAMSDGGRTLSFNASVLGLREDRLYVGWNLFANTLSSPSFRGGLAINASEHGGALVVVRERRQGAQLLGTDRHFTGGAVDVRSERWDEAGRTLYVGLRLARAGEGGYTTPLLVALRVDEAVQGVPAVLLDGAPIEGASVRRSGQLVSVRFVPPRAGDAVLSVRFGE